MKEPRWLDAEEQRAWRAFAAATHLLFDQLDRELLRDAGMPHAYYVILARLSEAPDRAMRMSDLAEHSQSSRSRLSHAIARLEEKGWVRRESCPTDRRGTVAVLTDEGFAALEAAAPRHLAGVRAHVFDQLTAAQVEQLRRISEALVRHLTALDNAAASSRRGNGLRSSPQAAGGDPEPAPDRPAAASTTGSSATGG